ncbi:hypothetical protein Tco_0782660 [Tanacetum coccineum]
MSDVEVAGLLLIVYSNHHPPLSPWSSPLPHIPSPPLPSIPSPSLLVSPLLPVSSQVLVLSPLQPASPIRSLGYQAAMIRLRAEAASTSHSLPLPPPIILSHARQIEPNIRDIYHCIYFSTTVERTYMRLPYTGLKRDKVLYCHQWKREIRRDLEENVSSAVNNKKLQFSIVRNRRVITKMLAADYKRKKQLIEALKLIKRLQTQMAVFERQQGPVKGPPQLELPEEAGSSS